MPHVFHFNKGFNSIPLTPPLGGSGESAGFGCCHNPSVSSLMVDLEILDKIPKFPVVLTELVTLKASL